MYNKKLLLTVLKDLNKAKKPTKKKDINYDATGKGMLNKNYAGKPVRLATDTLYNPTPYRINAKSDNGIEQTLEPYDETTVNFPGANYIDEYPEMKKGGGFSRNLLATNRLFKKNTLFKKNPLIKPNKLFKKKSYKRKTYDPMSMYFQDGGYIETELTPEEIEQYKKGGYIVEEVNDPAIPALNRYDNGGSPKSQWIAPAEMYSGRSNVDPTTGLIYKDLGDLDVKAGKKGFKRKVQDFFRKDIGKLTKEAEELGKGVGYIAGVQGDIEPAVYNREGIKKFKSEVKRLKGDFNTELKDAEKKRKQESDNKLEYDKWKKKLDDGKISASEFLLKGKGKNWEVYNDAKVAKGTGPGADYSATDARKEWGDSDQWNKFTGLVSNAATAIPLLGAAGAMGSAGAAILENPVVQGGLTAYGAYDATTNTLPEAYKDFSEGRYWEGLGNTALGALDFVPGVGLASKGAKLGYKGLGKAINYAKNLEPAAPGPMMLMGRFADDVAKTGDDVAKVVSKAETPKSNFKSEIDWDKWNPEISKNQELLQEYHAIEEAAKADGTWMKNPDGSPFVLPDGKAGQHWTFTKGTPEQFVQMQSQNFKKAYPEGFDAWYTGRMKDPTEQFPLFAELYPEGRSIFGGDYHVATRYASTQPEGYDTFKRITTEFKPKEITKFTDADQTAKAHGLISPKTSNSFLFNARKQGWREIPVGSDTGITPMWEGQPIENFRESLKTTFKNPKTGIDETGYKVKSDDIAEHLEKNNMDYATIEDVVDGSVADYVRIHNLKSGNYPKSLWGNNGMFDLSNPNIYKAIIPTVGVAGTATMLANPFQDSDGLQQQQYGGGLDRFVKGGGKKKKGKKTITKPGEWAGVNPELVQPGNEGFDLPTTPTVPAEFETIKCPIFHKYDPSVGDCVPFTEEEKAAYALDYMQGWVGSPRHEEMLRASIEKDAPAGDTDKYVKNITDLRLRATDPNISIVSPDDSGNYGVAEPLSLDYDARYKLNKLPISLRDTEAIKRGQGKYVKLNEDPNDGAYRWEGHDFDTLANPNKSDLENYIKYNSPLYMESGVNNLEFFNYNDPDYERYVKYDETQNIIDENYINKKTGEKVKMLPEIKSLKKPATFYTKGLAGEHGYVYPHEFSHLQDMGGDLIIPSDEKLMLKYFQPQLDAADKMYEKTGEVYDKYYRPKGVYDNPSEEDEKKYKEEIGNIFIDAYPSFTNRYNLDKNLYENNFDKYVLDNQHRFKDVPTNNSLPYDEFTKQYFSPTNFGDPAERAGYLGNRSESRARLNAVRMYGKASGTYDPYTEKLTPEKYNQLKELFQKENPNAKDANQLKQLQEVYTDEQILDLLNTISKNEPEQVDDFQPQQVQYGGALSKFIGGGSPCDDGYTYDPKLGCIPLSEENMTEDQKWMVEWYKNRKIQFPEDQPSFKKVVEKVLPAYNPESPMLEQMQSFPVYETMPKEYMQEDIGGFPAAGMYDTSGKVPKIYFNPELTPEQKSDTERHELTNYLMEPVKDKLYPMYNKIVEENIIPFDENWPKEKQDFYDYVIDPEEQNIQSYLNVARKKFNLKADEVITPERLNQMRDEAEKKGMLDKDNKNFNQDIYLLFKMAKDDEGLMKWFNLIAKKDSNKDDIQYGQYGGSMGYQLGDEIDEATMNELKRLGYTFEEI